MCCPNQNSTFGPSAGLADAVPRPKGEKKLEGGLA